MIQNPKLVKIKKKKHQLIQSQTYPQQPEKKGLRKGVLLTQTKRKSQEENSNCPKMKPGKHM